MNSKKAKAMRRRAKQLTEGSPERDYLEVNRGRTRMLSQSTRGAYQALKSGRFEAVTE